MKYPENLYIDTTFKDIKPYVEKKRKPYFTGDFDINLFQFVSIDNITHMTINQKAEKAFYIMRCNEQGTITDPYAVINKKFTTRDKAESFFNKYVRNVTLVNNTIKT